MSVARLPWKRSWFSLWPFSSFAALPICFGAAWTAGLSSTKPFSGHGRSWRSDEGFLLVSALPLLLLFFLALAGTVKIGLSEQAAVALQSRLDQCAVRLAVSRKRTLAQLAKANGPLRLTVLGIYAARGVKLAGPIGAAFGTLSEAALLQANRALGLFQDGLIAKASAEEAAKLLCPANRFSREPVVCLSNPPLPLAFFRESALFPDIRGGLMHRRRETALATIRCWKKSFRTTIELRGPARLDHGHFLDAYVD